MKTTKSQSFLKPVDSMDVITLDDALRDLRGRAKGTGQVSEPVRLGFCTGIAEIDALVGGIPPGTVVVTAGRPSMGQRQVALQMVLSAIGGGTPVLYFSTGFSRLSLAAMLAQLATGLGYRELIRGLTKEEECGRLDDWRDRYCRDEGFGSLYIDDTPAPDIDHIRFCMSQLPLDGGVIVLDRIDDMTPFYCQDSTSTDYHEFMEAISSLARNMGVVMIVMSNLDKVVEDRFDKRPRSEDLPSPALAAWSDLLLLHYREEIYRSESRHRGISEVTVAKNRISGTIGNCQFRISILY